MTSGGAGGRLRAASSGSGGLQFGGVWTVVIVAQIALTTLLPWPLLGLGGAALREDAPAGFPAEAFLTATLEVDRLDGDAASGDTVPAARAARLEARYRALADRLRQDPGVLDVTYADQMPQLTQGRHFIKMDPGPAAEHGEGCMEGYYCVGFVSVDPRFFDVVGAPLIRGRALTTADAEHRALAGSGLPRANRGTRVGQPVAVSRARDSRPPLELYDQLREACLSRTYQTTAEDAAYAVWFAAVLSEACLLCHPHARACLPPPGIG